MLVQPLLRVLIALWFLSLMIVFTFVQVRLPFISLGLPQLPDTWLGYESRWLYMGTYAGNLQIFIYFFCLFFLNGVLINLLLGLYLLLGLTSFPIFYHGGGPTYFQQPTLGFLLILMPAAWFWMLQLKRHPRKPIPVNRYIFVSILTLLLIYIAGGLYAALAYNIVPTQFLFSFILPHLCWNIPAVIFIALLYDRLPTSLKQMLLNAGKKRRSPKQRV